MLRPWEYGALTVLPPAKTWSVGPKYLFGHPPHESILQRLQNPEQPNNVSVKDIKETKETRKWTNIFIAQRFLVNIALE